MSSKPHFRVIAGRPVAAPDTRETALQAAQRKYGRPFAHQRGNMHQHTSGPAYWTAERIAQLSARNEENRMKRGKR